MFKFEIKMPERLVVLVPVLFILNMDIFFERFFFALKM